MEQQVITRNLAIGFKMYDIKSETLEFISGTMARKFNVIPLRIRGNNLNVAMEDINDIIAIDALSSKTEMQIEPVFFSGKDIKEAIEFYYPSLEQIEIQVSRMTSPSATRGEETVILDEASSPIVRAISLIIEEAIGNGASDIHFQPQESELLVRYRVDGTLHDVLRLPLHSAELIISRIKIMANLNIADHLHPQDGQFFVERKGQRERIDIRVGILPSVHGETAALRLLDKAKVLMDLTQLGFLPESLTIYRNMLQTPHGMILVCGPTGAGKTTTLYSSINSLDYMQRNIITIEDPVEYDFHHITQIKVNTRSGLTFATGLRSILRVDPDVILVGEIRDKETAEIAVQSALTGHLVLSSIHANDAIGAVSRLIDLGIEPFLVSSALIGVVSQRMLRKICNNCAEEINGSFAEKMAYAQELGEERSEFLYGNGCESCNSGYRGRMGIYETMRVTDDLRTMIVNRASAPELQQQAVKDGMIPLLKAGMMKVKQNITTPSEVLRNAY